MWPAEARLTASDVHAGMTSGCVELLRTGCTTSTEMYFFTDAVIDAVTTVGSRVVLTPGIIAAPGWDRLGSWEQMRDDVSARIDDVGLRSGPGERIELGYGPHSAYTLRPDALASVAERARSRGALVHLPAFGDDLDLWAEARLAGLLARVTSADAAALTASELLLMATRDGAAAIGRDDLGVLEAGRWADLVHIDLADPAFTDPDDDAQLLSNLIWAGGSRLVRDVWVAGEHVLVDGEPTRVDRAATTAALRGVTASLRT